MRDKELLFFYMKLNRCLIDSDRLAVKNEVLNDNFYYGYGHVTDHFNAFFGFKIRMLFHTYLRIKVYAKIVFSILIS